MLLLRAKSQIHPLQIGDKVPDLKIVNIVNADSSSFNLSHFKGKGVIIDFWGTWCGSCVEALPNVLALQKKFRNDLQIITVSEEKRETVKKFFASGPYKNTQTLNAAAGNAILRQYFPHQYVPHEIWIGKDGKLKAVTGADEVNETSIKKFIKDTSINLHTDIIHWLAPTDNDRELGKILNGDIPNVKEQSFFTGYIRGQANTCTASPEALKRLKLQSPSQYQQIPGKYQLQYQYIYVKNVSPVVLYKVAYGYPAYAKFYPNSRIIYEFKDSLNYELFHKKHKANDTDLVCYRLQLLLPDSIRIYKRMQTDIDDYFRIRAKIEKREMQCYTIRVIDSTRLGSNGRVPSSNSSLLFYKCTNMPLSDFADELSSYNEGHDVGDKKAYIIINDTNWNKNVDLDIQGPFNDLKMLKKNLNKYGLDLILEKRMVDMLVLRDMH